MKKIYYVPAAIIGIGLATPALAAEETTSETRAKTTVERNDDGSYQKKQTQSAKNTDAAGTTTTSETKVEVNADAEGNADREVKTETSTDPKGLLNKTKTVTTDSVKYKDGNVEKKYQKKVDGKVVEENKEETSTN